MSEPERILKTVPEAFCIVREGTAGPEKTEGLGTVVVTDRRIAFVRRKGLFQVLIKMPTITSVEQLDKMLSAQGGVSVLLSAIKDAGTRSSKTGYGGGNFPCSDLTIVYEEPSVRKTFRLFGEQAAGEVFNLMSGAARGEMLRAASSGGAPPPRTAPLEGPVSPSAAALAELGLGADYALPAPPDQGPQVAFLRATLGFAWKQIREKKWDYAVNDASKLLDEHNLKVYAAYGPGLAAAFYIRGLGHEKKGNREKAAADYRESLARRSDYQPAVEGLRRLGV